MRQESTVPPTRRQHKMHNAKNRDKQKKRILVQPGRVLVALARFPPLAAAPCWVVARERLVSPFFSLGLLLQLHTFSCHTAQRSSCLFFFFLVGLSISFGGAREKRMANTLRHHNKNKERKKCKGVLFPLLPWRARTTARKRWRAMARHLRSVSGLWDARAMACRHALASPRRMNSVGATHGRQAAPRTIHSFAFAAEGRDVPPFSAHTWWPKQIHLCAALASVCVRAGSAALSELPESALTTDAASVKCVGDIAHTCARVHMRDWGVLPLMTVAGVSRGTIVFGCRLQRRASMGHHRGPALARLGGPPSACLFRPHRVSQCRAPYPRGDRAPPLFVQRCAPFIPSPPRL
nr:hypothetical protein [Pandoravirus massiliensis]